MQNLVLNEHSIAIPTAPTGSATVGTTETSTEAEALAKGGSDLTVRASSECERVNGCVQSHAGEFAGFILCEYSIGIDTGIVKRLLEQKG